MSTVRVFHHILSSKMIRPQGTKTSGEALQAFSRKKAPPLNLFSYIDRLHDLLSCPDEVFALALGYLNRLLRDLKSFSINSRNVHRIVLVAVVLAFKFSQDTPFKNSAFAKIGGVKTSELNELEVIMLDCLNWELVEPDLDYWLEKLHSNLDEESQSSTEDDDSDIVLYDEAQENESFSELSYLLMGAI